MRHLGLRRAPGARGQVLPGDPPAPPRGPQHTLPREPASSSRLGPPCRGPGPHPAVASARLRATSSRPVPRLSLPLSAHRAAPASGPPRGGQGVHAQPPPRPGRSCPSPHASAGSGRGHRAPRQAGSARGTELRLAGGPDVGGRRGSARGHQLSGALRGAAWGHSGARRVAAQTHPGPRPAATGWNRFPRGRTGGSSEEGDSRPPFPVEKAGGGGARGQGRSGGRGRADGRASRLRRPTRPARAQEQQGPAWSFQA